MNEARIESYILGEMEPLERQNFEDQLLEDDKLVNEVRLYESVVEGIKDRGREKLKMRFLQLEYQLLDAEGIEMVQSDEPSFVSHLKWAIGLVIIVVPLIYYLIPSKNPAQIFNSYYEEFENKHIVYVSGRDSLTLYEQAFMAYDAKEYAKAVKLFEELEKNSTDRIAVPFFLSMSYLANDQADVALHKYWMLIQTEEHDFLEPAHWYLALSMVKVGKLPEAKKELKKIIASESVYQEKARRLLQRL